ncbi:hypothetical protein C8F04DRAFT_911554, partial [Mycena alexandri]
VKITAALKPAQLNFDDYIISFTVPRQLSDPIQLTNDSKYKYLVDHALKIKANPNAKIVIEVKAVRLPENKENEMDGEKGKKREKTKVKPTLDRLSRPKLLQVRTERDILPANLALNGKMAAICEKWICPDPGGPCGSDHCFIHPNEPEHFPLSHAHIESWGAAWLKGPEFADINKPPNNALFDRLDPKTLAAQSSWLKRRLELKQTAAPQPK